MGDVFFSKELMEAKEATNSLLELEDWEHLFAMLWCQAKLYIIAHYALWTVFLLAHPPLLLLPCLFDYCIYMYLKFWQRKTFPSITTHV